MTRDKWRRCRSCPATEITCKTLTRDRGRPCCPNHNHEPIEEEENHE